MGSIDNKLEKKTKRDRREKKFKKKTNQYVLDVHHAWLAMCSQREHNKY
jgi:hypothetical protein